MKFLKKLNIHILFVAIVAGMVSCANENDLVENMSAHSDMTVKAEIKSLRTRVESDSIEVANDGWSHSYFQTGDTISFYSSHGALTQPLGRDSVINLPMVFMGGSNFKNVENFQFAPSRMSAGEIFMYYPYCRDMVDEEGLSANAEGITLRRESEGMEKCIDFLTLSEVDALDLSSGVIAGKFTHAFAELILMRGEGFDMPLEGKDTITAVMQNPYTNVQIKYTVSPWSCTPELIYDASSGLTQDEAKSWKSWQGENYGKTEEDPIGRPAWYILLPTLANYRTTVDYIELYDNEGNLQKVTSLELAPGPNGVKTKYLENGWRYPLIVEMKELVPTINPFPITPWAGDTDLTNQRKRGIYNATDFDMWRAAYASYLSDGNNESELLKYGDKIADSNGNTLYWHFYLLGDIDLAQDPNGRAAGSLIPLLKDILDGENHNEMENNTRPNYQITGLSQTLVGSMSGYGALMNMDFVSPYVTTESSAPAGILVNTVSDPAPMVNEYSGCLIDNCNIQYGTLNSQGPVGIIAGSVTTTTIRNCDVTGLIIGTETVSPYNIAGQETNSIFENISSNVIFQPYE